jgi:hypothetical protein
MNDIIILEPHGDLQATANQSAIELIDEAISFAQSFDSVDDAFEAEGAADALRKLDEIIKAVSAAHSEAKRPFLEFGRSLDRLKKDLLEDVEINKRRISLELGKYQSAEREKQRAAEAEAKRVLVESTHTDDADAIASAKAQAAELAKVAAPVKGIKAREVMRFEVLDGQTLVSAHPELFNVGNNIPDTEIKPPLKGRIASALRAFGSLKGVRAWKESKATF